MTTTYRVVIDTSEGSGRLYEIHDHGHTFYVDYFSGLLVTRHSLDQFDSMEEAVEAITDHVSGKIYDVRIEKVD